MAWKRVTGHTTETADETDRPDEFPGSWYSGAEVGVRQCDRRLQPTGDSDEFDCRRCSMPVHEAVADNQESSQLLAVSDLSSLAYSSLLDWLRPMV